MTSPAARAGALRTTVRSATRPARTRTATARPTTARPTTTRRPTSLRVVPDARRRIARGPFVGVVVAVLAAGLLGLLLLNTMLAQDSFRLHALQKETRALAEREQALQREVSTLEAPAALAARAQAQGMVPAGPPAFLRLPDGAVLGEPRPATAPPAPPPPPAPAADPAAEPGAGAEGGTAAAAAPDAAAGTSTATGTADTPSAAPSGRASTAPSARASAAPAARASAAPSARPSAQPSPTGAAR